MVILVDLNCFYKEWTFWDNYEKWKELDWSIVNHFGYKCMFTLLVKRQIGSNMYYICIQIDSFLAIQSTVEYSFLINWFHSKLVIKETLKSKVNNFLSPKPHTAFFDCFCLSHSFLFSFGRLVSYHCLLCISIIGRKNSKAEEPNNGK